MFTDTHAHLSDPDFADDLPAVIERARAAGVQPIISVATGLADARRVLEIAGHHAGVFAAVGLHPNSVPGCRLCDMKPLAELAGHPRVVAIGETGLDYYRGDSHKQQQHDLLWAQLDLARQRRLPVIIHNRAANADLLDILRAHAAGLPKDWQPWGVMHCFSGDEKFAFDCLEIGLLISYTGILTFQNAAALRDAAKKVSLDHVMLETDAPYLAPAPHRGQRNEPAHIPHIADVLAHVKGVTVEEVARMTTLNAKRLFDLS